MGGDRAGAEAFVDQPLSFNNTSGSMTPTLPQICLECLALALVCLQCACTPPPKAPRDSLTLAIQERAQNSSPRPDTASPKKKKSQAHVHDPAPASNGPSIAVVGEISIARDQFDSFLTRSRGVAVLEQQVGLAAAEGFALKKGVTVSPDDIDFEYGLALRRLSDPQAFSAVRDFERAEAERLLESILASRNMSRPEFMLTVRRNAILRRLLIRDLSITEEQLRMEYELAYGERVLVRHIQVGNLAEASRIMERLAAGEDFAELATRFSTNAATARRGGMFDPFSLRDEHIPQAMRQAVGRLSVGEVSDVVRVGEWYHILKLEELIPAQQRGFESVREDLRKRMEVRLTDAEMRTLHEKLFSEAPVEIFDPLLLQEFRAAFPGKSNVTAAFPAEGG